jgi:23S rRNA (adenine2503-C2)-methyltransferase
VEGLPWKRPEISHCQAVRNILSNAGVTATLRLEKGHDIEAACGQLRLVQETEEGIISPVERKA